MYTLHHAAISVCFRTVIESITATPELNIVVKRLLPIFSVNKNNTNNNNNNFDFSKIALMKTSYIFARF